MRSHMLDATQLRPGAAGVHAAADLPFDKKHLDDLLEADNIDILLVTSKHNIQFMLGGYRFFFFDQFDAIGITRYLPIIIYPKGRPDRAVYVGNAMEDSEAENGRFWCPTIETRSWGTLDATDLAIDQVINSGDIISLDSGGRYGGYIGDLCRMGIAGRPDAELDDSLGWVEAVQQAARTPIRSGMLGKEIFAAVKDVLSSSPHSANTHFVAHGVGVIGHEAPRLSDRGPVTYPAYDANLPLQAGMVLSIETTLMHPRRGFIKLEDTVAVTETGWDAFGDKGRGWNCGDPPMMSPGPDQHQ